MVGNLLTAFSIVISHSIGMRMTTIGFVSTRGFILPKLMPSWTPFHAFKAGR